jgi:hypothetical protein
LGGQGEGQRQFDRVVSLNGFRPTSTFHGELKVQLSDDTEAPIALAVWLRSQNTRDALARASSGVDTLTTGEPNFYILGSKSHGRDTSFLFAAGLTQIQQLFTLIGDRKDLDLYANTVNPLWVA